MDHFNFFSFFYKNKTFEFSFRFTSNVNAGFPWKAKHCHHIGRLHLKFSNRFGYLVLPSFIYMAQWQMRAKLKAFLYFGFVRTPVFSKGSLNEHKIQWEIEIQRESEWLIYSKWKVLLNIFMNFTTNHFAFAIFSNFSRLFILFSVFRWFFFVLYTYTNKCVCVRVWVRGTLLKMLHTILGFVCIDGLCFAIRMHENGRKLYADWKWTRR